MSTKKNKIDDDLLDRLGTALDLLAAVLIEVGGLSDEVPGNAEALDVALGRDAEFTETKKRFHTALSPLTKAVPTDTFLIEELGHQLAGRGAEVGLLVGRMMAGAATRGRGDATPS